MYTVILFVIAVLLLFSYIIKHMETCKIMDELEDERARNATLHAACEKLADENLRLEQAMREQNTKAGDP